MRKALIFIMVLMSVGLPITASDVFKELKVNYADMSHGEAVFVITNPTNKDVTVNKDLMNYYIRWNNTPVTAMGIWVMEPYQQEYRYNYTTITYNVTVNNTECDETGCWDWLENQTVEEITGYNTTYKTAYETKPVTGYTFRKGQNYTIYINATWEPKYNVSMDWVPFLNLSGTKFEFPQWQTWGGTELLYEEFVTMDNGWTGWMAQSVGWNLTNGAGPWYNTTDMSAAMAYDTDASAGQFLNKSVNLYGWKDINISFWANTTGNDAGEGLIVKYWNGFTWITVFTQQGDTAAWNYTSLMLDAQDVADFKISFWCVQNLAAESCQLDTVRITGWSSNKSLYEIIPIWGNNSGTAPAIISNVNDSDNDGFNDIVVVPYTNPSIARILNITANSFRETVLNSTSYQKPFMLGDFVFQDGRSDIYFATTKDWVQSNISGGFPSFIINASTQIDAVTFGDEFDVDNDGYDEIIRAIYYGSAEHLQIIKNTSGGFRVLNDTVTAQHSAAQGAGYIVGDFDYDNLNELLYVHSGRTSILDNHTIPGVWTNRTIWLNGTTGNTYNAIDACDFDSDGYEEAMITNRVIKNQSGRFEMVKYFSGNHSPINAVRCADIEKDDDIDVFMLLKDGSLIVVLNGSSSYVYYNITTFPYLSFNPAHLSFGDIFNNGTNQIIVSSQYLIYAIQLNLTFGGEPPATYAFSITVPGGNYSNSSEWPVLDKRQTDYKYINNTGGSQAKVVTPVNMFDSGFGDTSTYGQITANDTTYAWLNVTYTINGSTSTYLYYTLKTYAPRYLSVYAYNWTSEQFQLMDNVTTGASILKMGGNKTDASWVNSTNGTLFKFVNEYYNEYTDIYDIYLAEAPAFAHSSPIMNFTYNGSYGGDQDYVNASFGLNWQTAATPALLFTNLGTTALTWKIQMNHSLPPWVTIFANDTNALPLTGNGAFVFTDSNFLSLSVAPSSTKSLWVYANFTGVTASAGYLNYTQLNHTSS